jgi:hypothetical protein
MNASVSNLFPRKKKKKISNIISIVFGLDELDSVIADFVCTKE